MEEPQEQQNQHDSRPMSRRDFLAGAGGFAAGLGIGSVLSGGGLSLIPKAAAQAKEVPAWPWPYERLDPENVRKRGHLAYYEGGCAYGAFKAIIGALQDEVGHPYTLMPVDIMRYGGGGVLGWGTICGALNGSAAAITLVTGKSGYGKLVNELMGWYTENPFPSDKSNAYAKNKAFLVKEYKYEGVLPQSVSGSPLCHVSVSQWCVASKYGSGSQERLERCARLTGDVAAHSVELLNAYHNGAFKAAFAMSAETEGCRSCHNGSQPFEMGGFSDGKMECTQCHEPHL